MCQALIFSSDMTMISYFNIDINILIITNPAFNSIVLKILIILTSFHSLQVSLNFFYHTTIVLAFLNDTINKILSSIFPYI